MLYLTRLSGQHFALNADLIERAEATPDTVVTLVNGSKYIIRETLDELIECVRSWRSELVAATRVGATVQTAPPSPPMPRSRVARHVAAAGESRAEADATVVPLRVEQGEF